LFSFLPFANKTELILPNYSLKIIETAFRKPPLNDLARTLHLTFSTTMVYIKKKKSILTGDNYDFSRKNKESHKS
jgi:hypothetical protein